MKKFTINNIWAFIIILIVLIIFVIIAFMRTNDKEGFSDTDVNPIQNNIDKMVSYIDNSSGISNTHKTIYLGYINGENNSLLSNYKLLVSEIKNNKGNIHEKTISTFQDYIEKKWVKAIGNDKETKLLMRYKDNILTKLKKLKAKCNSSGECM